MVERLVEYSDSSEEEEQEWYAFRNQRSSMRMSSRDLFHPTSKRCDHTSSFSSFTFMNERPTTRTKRASFPLSPPHSVFTFSPVLSTDNAHSMAMDTEDDDGPISTPNTIATPQFKQMKQRPQAQDRVSYSQKDLHRAAKRRGNISQPSVNNEPAASSHTSPMDVEYQSQEKDEDEESPNAPWMPWTASDDEEEKNVFTNVFKTTNALPRRRMSTGSRTTSVRFDPTRKPVMQRKVKPIPEVFDEVSGTSSSPFTFTVPTTPSARIDPLVKEKEVKRSTNVFIFGATDSRKNAEENRRKSEEWNCTASFSIGRTIPSTSNRSRRTRLGQSTSTKPSGSSNSSPLGSKTLKKAAKALFQTQEDKTEDKDTDDATSVFSKLAKEQEEVRRFFPFQRPRSPKRQEETTTRVETNVFVSKTSPHASPNQPIPTFSFNTTSTPIEPEPSPPVENLKSSFDIFGIAKTKENTTSETDINTTSPNPFEWKQTKTRTKEYKQQTPPADPFVTPVYTRTSKTRTSHASHSSRSTSARMKKDKQSFGTDMNKTNPSLTPHLFSRRFAQAVHPKGSVSNQDDAKKEAEHPKVSASQQGDAKKEKTDEEPEEDSSEWGYWKQRGGEDYTMRLFQEAADCYQRSLESMEDMYTADPLLRTESLLQDRAKLHANRAAALMMVWQLSEAQQECLQAIAIDDCYIRAYVRLCRIYVLRGDIENAKTTRAKCIQLMGLNHEETKDLERVEQGINKLVALQGDLQWSKDVGDDDRVLSIVQEALAIAPSSRTLQLHKVQALFRQKKYAEVESFCRHIIQKTGGLSHTGDHELSGPYQQEATFLGLELSIVRIQSLHYHNKIEEAMNHLTALETIALCSERVIQLKNKLNDMKQLKQQANKWFKAQDFERAIVVYSQALLLDPSHDAYCAVIYCNRAAALMGLKRYESAIRDCIAALNRRTHYSKARLRRARCYVAMKQYALALVDFDLYLKDGVLSREEQETIGLERLHAQVSMDKEVEDARRREAAQKKKERQQREKQKKEQQSRYSNGWDIPKSHRWGSSSSNNHSKGNNTPSKVVCQKTHYQLLGITKHASQDEIKKAYRKLALIHHPDKAKDIKQADLFKDMTAAYTILSDVTARALYDREQGHLI